MARPMPKPILQCLTLLLLASACSRTDLAYLEPAPAHDHGEHQASGLLEVEVVAGPAVRDAAAFTTLFLEGFRPDPSLPLALAASRDIDGLPATLTVEAADLTLPGVLRGEWRLVARLDQDGHAPITPGDVAGEATTTVAFEGGKVTITLDTELGPDDVVPDQEPRFRGTLDVSPELAERAAGGVLFLNIKQSPDARGMPRASLRLDRPSFPLRFDIGPEHVPLQVENKADVLLGELWFAARIDADGNAMTRGEDDLIHEPLPIRAGDPPITVTLDQLGP